MEAVLDIVINKLVFPQKTVPLTIPTMGLPEFTVNAHSTKVLKNPVDQQKGNVFLRKDIKINEIVIP